MRQSSQLAKFEPEQICAVLVEEGVQFVLVGGLAAVLHGSPLPTVDIDVVPERADENVERLANALNRLGAKLRTEAGPVDAPIDAGFIRAMPLMLNLVTDFGDIDLTYPSPPTRIDCDQVRSEWLCVLHGSAHQP